VEKRKYDLCLEVLRRLNKCGILKHCILVGSWCLPFYKEYFKSKSYLVSITTRDIDIMIPVPKKITIKTDVVELLKDLGFIIDFSGSKGYIRLVHPDLVVEFLVPEMGRGSEKPYPLPQLGLNAQPLRFMDLLAEKTIKVKVDGIVIQLPDPAIFALHKFIIAPRRTDSYKEIKDQEAGLRVYNALISAGKGDKLKYVFEKLPMKWQTKIRKQLEKLTPDADPF